MQNNDNNKDTRLDDAFKAIMSDSYILAQVLKPLFKEFKEKDTEFIRSCLPVREGNREIICINSEYNPNHNGPAFLDNVFELNIPGEDTRTILIGLEGQGRRNPGYKLMKRAKYYTSCMIVDQKDRYFSNDDYDSICKVVSIWIILNPRKEDRNTIRRYYTANDFIPGFEGVNKEEGCDLEEVFEIGIGGPDDLPQTMMGLLNTLFSRGLEYKERMQRLVDSYNIGKADYLMNKLEEITMTLDEEVRATWMCEGVEEAIESGEVITKEDHEAGRVDDATKTIKLLMDHGFSLEDSLEYISVDLRDSVKETILKGCQES